MNKQKRKTKRKKENKRESKIVKVFLTILLVLGFLIIFLTNWLHNTFQNVSVEEIVFTLKVPLQGANHAIIFNFIIEVLLTTLIASAIAYFILFFKSKVDMILKFKFKKISLDIKILPISKIVSVPIVLILLVYSIFNFLNVIPLNEYITNQKTESKLIENEYANAKETKLKFPSKKRNLIYIYLESMESSYTSYSNGGMHENNLIPELTTLAKDNVNFSHTDKLGGALTVPATTWTTAALVAQTSGLPLKIGIRQSGYGKYQSFLSGAYTIGDVLEENGYNQEFMFGSDSDFSGKKLYLEDHGNYKIYDYYTAIEKGKITEEDKVWWGFEDKNLYAWSKEEILKLASKKEPFNYSLLTVDTHFEDGYLSSSCPKKYSDQYSNVISCASKQLYDFVQWIKKQDFYENTTIVITGDHVTMDSDFYNKETENGREIYNVIINSPIQPKKEKNRTFTTMDMYPTTLAALGVEIDGDRLGIGTNLFSDKKTVAEKYGIEKLREELDKTSKFYSKKFIYDKK